MFIDSSKKMTTPMQLNTNNNDNYHEGSARAIWIALFECGLPTTMSKHCLQLSATCYYCFLISCLFVSPNQEYVLYHATPFPLSRSLTIYRPNYIQCSK